MNRRNALSNLLLSLFDAGELRRLVLDLPGGDDLAPRLPGATVSHAHLVAEVIGVLERDGLLADPRLWDALIAERPRRRPEIVAVCGLFTNGATGSIDAEPANTQRRILFVSASPEPARRLAVDLEVRRLRETLRASTYRDRIALEIQPAADYDALERALRATRPHILHLSCHGDPSGALLLADERGDVDVVPPEMLLGLLRLLTADLELVVVNACHSHVVAEQIPPTVGHAIGMSDALTDEAAIDFTRKLYENLADGATVSDAFALACNKLHKYGAQQTPRLFRP